MSAKVKGVSAKWKGVDINLVPPDERDCERQNIADEEERKKLAESGKVSPNAIVKVPTDDEREIESHVDESRQSLMRAMTRMNAPSMYSKGLHSGMTSKSGAQNVNKRRIPDSPMGTQMVAKQDRDRPMPIPQSKEDERLRKELNAARKQIELDEQDKEALRETIEKQKKMIAELEKRPLLTDENIADLVTLRKRKEGEARRNAEYNKRHGYA